MSRILSKKIKVPSNVKIAYNEGKAEFACGNNRTALNLPVKISVDTEGNVAFDDHALGDAILTTYYVLVKNAIADVLNPFVAKIKIIGVGYNASVNGKFLRLFAGYSHNIFFAIPEGVSVAIKDDVEITLTGCDRCAVSSFANAIRSVRKPEPYKGKGIFVNDEKILRKEGKKK